jgi:hypothetical protein
VQADGHSCSEVTGLKQISYARVLRERCERLYTGLFLQVFARIHARENTERSRCYESLKTEFDKTCGALARSALPMSRSQPDGQKRLKLAVCGVQAADQRGSAEENSSLSPGLVCVLSIEPIASSTTECAERQADRRQGGTPLLTFFTFLLRSK